MSINEIPYGVYDVEIGESFTVRPSANDETADGDFHTLKYDFKPKSAASEQETYISIAENKDVQVVVPNEGLDQMAVYKGSMKPIKGDKECMLVFDHSKKKLCLEKLSSNISLKKTRDNIVDDEETIKERIQEVRLRRKPKHRHEIREADATLLAPINNNGYDAMADGLAASRSQTEGDRTTSFFGILAAELASSPSAHSSGSSSSSSSSDSSNSDSDSSSDDENDERKRPATVVEDAKPRTATASEHESDDDEHVQAIEKLMSESQQPPTGGDHPGRPLAAVGMANDTLATHNASSVLDDLYMSDASGSESD